METITGIPGGISSLAPLGPDSHQPSLPSSPAPGVESAPEAAPRLAHSPEDIEAAVADLQESLSHLPGGERDVRLLWEEEDRSFVIEIWDKETGELIQKFPPENLLNQSRRPADLLGTMIDRLS